MSRIAVWRPSAVRPTRIESTMATNVFLPFVVAYTFMNPAISQDPERDARVQKRTPAHRFDRRFGLNLVRRTLVQLWRRRLRASGPALPTFARSTTCPRATRHPTTRSLALRIRSPKGRLATIHTVPKPYRPYEGKHRTWVGVVIAAWNPLQPRAPPPSCVRRLRLRGLALGFLFQSVNS